MTLYSLVLFVAVFLGIVLLMAAKRELWESVSVVGTSVALGLLATVLVRHRTGSLLVPSADLGD